jgi:hypothetical protein
MILITSCNNKSAIQENPPESNQKVVADSSYSKFDRNSMTFKNVNYSLETFDYKKENQEFICKTSSESVNRTKGMRLYKEKRVFFDLNMNKVFEIYAVQRTIELSSKYYITKGLSQELPRYFELNNYGDGKPFVKCTGVLWTVEIPNSETIAFFGSRSNNNRRDTLTIGEIYFSINQTENVKLIVKASNYELRKRIYSNVPFRIESINSKDKTFNNTTLTLWSKDNQIGEQFITDINLIIKAGYDLSDNNWENNQIKEFKIPIVKGKLQANKISEDTYEFTINE